jgi:hypothetical protein
MLAIRSVFPQAFVYGALTTVVFTCGLPAHAQVTKGCSGIGYLGADSSNPFIAEYVTTSTTPASLGVPKMIVRRENVARDSRGRIRFEKHGVAQPPDDRKTVALETPDGKPFTVTREEYGTLIEIFDCASGTFVRIQPGTRIATLKENTTAAPARQSKHAYSTPYIPGPGVKIPPNITVELLGNREIQGIPARGVKTTTLGTEKDGDWNGKPISESELWVSDDLAAQLLSIRKDLKTGAEARSELMAIKREEPDPVLFEIPKDYEVNPARMPIAKDLAVVRPRPQ